MNVLVVASGSTERAALPHLLREVESGTNHRLVEVVIPPGHRALNGKIVSQLATAGYWKHHAGGSEVGKIVVLHDADRRDPGAVREELESELESLLTKLTNRGVHVLVAVAKPHIEGWFYADGESLRDFLGRDLGAAGGCAPDDMENPKLHLTHLLKQRGRHYTARTAGEIASRTDPGRCRTRSPSFAAFELAVRNGHCVGGSLEAEIS